MYIILNFVQLEMTTASVPCQAVPSCICMIPTVENCTAPGKKVVKRTVLTND